MINYISNLPRDLRTGGFSAMNALAFQALTQNYHVKYAGPISMTSNIDEKVASKIRRTLSFPGAFHQYSERRLASIAREVESLCDPTAQLDFFHGFTPWVRTRSSRPYVAWSDCTFCDYVQIYHNEAQFLPADIARITSAEAEWLAGARRIAFTSRWAADNAVRDYGLNAEQIDVVGIFGETEAPEYDAYAGATYFAFVSTDFVAKGGAVVLDAFRALRTEQPDAELIVIGDAPPDLTVEPGVETTGFLRKEDPDQHRRFREILAGARAVVHPTRSDIAPLLLVEAALYGCPVIATRRFAIPEIVEDRRTGLLVHEPTDVSEVSDAMRRMLQDEIAYAAMRDAAWNKSRSSLTKTHFRERLVATVECAIT